MPPFFTEARVKFSSFISLFAAKNNDIKTKGLIKMAKQGMKRPQETHVKPRNTEPAVPEIQGKAKHGHEKANPIIAGTSTPMQKVFHADPHKREKPVSRVYPVIDNDLARDNAENDITAADLQDL